MKPIRGRVGDIWVSLTNDDVLCYMKDKIQNEPAEYVDNDDCRSKILEAHYELINLIFKSPCNLYERDISDPNKPNKIFFKGVL